MWDLTSPQGIEPKPPALEGKVLTTGPPGKSLDISFSSKCLSKYMGFSRQEYWSELSFPSPRDLPEPGINPTSHALAGGLSTTETSGKPSSYCRPGPKGKDNIILFSTIKN